MYLTRRQRLLAEIDPTVVERERADAAAYRERQRIVGAMDRAAAYVATLERRKAEGEPIRNAALDQARHNLEHYTAAAERAGLIRPRKETVQ